MNPANPTPTNNSVSTDANAPLSNSQPAATPIEERPDPPSPVKSEPGTPVDARLPLPEYSYEDLEKRFEAKVKECEARELGMREEYEGWVEVRFP